MGKSQGSNNTDKGKNYSCDDVNLNKSKFFCIIVGMENDEISAVTQCNYSIYDTLLVFTPYWASDRTSVLYRKLISFSHLSTIKWAASDHFPEIQLILSS